jgi:hypothetical protein
MVIVSPAMAMTDPMLAARLSTMTWILAGWLASAL